MLSSYRTCPATLNGMASPYTAIHKIEFCISVVFFMLRTINSKTAVLMLSAHRIYLPLLYPMALYPPPPLSPPPNLPPSSPAPFTPPRHKHPQAHSKALQMAAAKLGPEAFERHVRPIKAQVGDDVDAATLAAKVVTRVVERSEVRKERGPLWSKR